MKKKKRLILLIGISITLILIFTIISSMTSNKETKNIATKVCEDITEKIKTKNQTIIFFVPKTSSSEASDTIEKFSENYPEINIINISDTDIKNNCIKNVFQENSIYEDLTRTVDTSAIAYKDGKNIGMIMGLDTYDLVEKYFFEIDFIEKKETKESIDLNDFKEKTKNEDYLLLIVGTEEQRVELTKLMTKYFSEYKYDVINLKSTIGEKIKNDIQNNNEVSNEYPQMFYYQNGKLIKYEHVYDTQTFEQYKKDLNLLNN